MGYDYTREFLVRRSEDVAIVRQVYQTQQPVSAIFTYPNEAVVARKNINNVLRSLAMYYPDEFVDVRRKVRTKTELMPDGRWKLTLYAPRPGEVVLGRPPGRSTDNTWIGASESQPMAAATNGEYQFPDLVRGPEEFTKLTGQVLEMPPEVKQVFAEFEVEIANLQYFQDLFGEHGWIAHLNGPTTLILERP